MIVIMEAGIQSADPRVAAVVAKARLLGINPVPETVTGTEFAVTQVLLKDGTKVRSASLPEYFFQAMEGVQDVRRVTPPSVSLAHNGGSYHRIKIGGVEVATNLPCRLIAGPCTVDKEIYGIVSRLVQLGVKQIRGGCWKPRSNPDAFPGFGSQAVEWLFEAACRYGVETVCLEVIESEHISIVQSVVNRTGFTGTVILWVGARTSNPILLKALGSQMNFPVMVKIGLNDGGIDDIAARMEWVLARQSVWNENGSLDSDRSLTPGNNRVIACLRGTKQTDKHNPYRFIPNHSWTKIIQQRWWAPVCIDPSHSAGEELLVIENTEDALRFKPSLVMVEGGYEGEYRGLCDANQSVSIGNMPKIIKLVADHNEKVYGIRTF